jgi:hypothetical protein
MAGKSTESMSVTMIVGVVTRWIGAGAEKDECVSAMLQESEVGGVDGVSSE